MTFKEYVKWCNERAADGCWGMVEALACMDIVSKVRKLPFWKREKEWQANYAKAVYDEIVQPTNNKINELRKNI